MNNKNISTEMIREGIILPVNKDIDWTSFDVVKKIRVLFNLRKAGHAGTLDPKATGLLLIATENKTKEINSLMDLDKEYIGIMRLGEETISGDTETEKIREYDISKITEVLILNNVNNFIGEIEQVPPMHSAIKFKGKPLYKFARSGKEVERKPKKIIISTFDVLNIEMPDIHFKIICSKGTYIRTLVTDFAARLGVGAFLKSLNRTRIGKYNISQAFTINELSSIRYPEKAVL